ncbi:MAG: hypothetical protein GF333_01100 [Candidatus Omnitrophica bacterium]|nr:hypothetical protein [Candidatus Omnitrophota bacterium]
MSSFSLYALCTDEAEYFKKIFLKTLRDDWDVRIDYLGAAGEGGGDWSSPGFLELVRIKLQYLVRLVKENYGKVIIWSDLDIQFFRECTPLIRREIKGKDILFQAEHWPQKEINSGFMVIRCNEKTLSFFEAVLKIDYEKMRHFDQSAINAILQENTIGLRWDVLPRQFWAMTHGGNPPRDIVLHHANGTVPCERNGRKIGSLQLKIEQLKHIRRQVRRRQLKSGLSAVRAAIRKISSVSRKGVRNGTC